MPLAIFATARDTPLKLISQKALESQLNSEAKIIGKSANNKYIYTKVEKPPEATLTFKSARTKRMNHSRKHTVSRVASQASKPSLLSRTILWHGVRCDAMRTHECSLPVRPCLLPVRLACVVRCSPVLDNTVSVMKEKVGKDPQNLAWRNDNNAFGYL